VSGVILRVTSAHGASLSFRAKDRGSGLSNWALVNGRTTLARRTRFAGAQNVTMPRRVPSHLRLVLHDKAGNTKRTAVRIVRRR